MRKILWRIVLVITGRHLVYTLNIPGIYLVYSRYDISFLVPAKIKVMTCPGDLDVIAGGAGGMGPCPPLRMSSRQWEKFGLLPSGKALDNAPMYGTDLSNEENAESMMRMFVGLPAEVITQGVSKIHEEFSKFFCAEYFNNVDNESDNTGGPLALLRGI
jgi:hypothetical protein